MIKNVIFDFGGVLIDWNPDRVYEAHFGDKEKVNHFYIETKIKDLNVELDRGLAFQKGLEDLAKTFPHHEEPIRFWRERWPHMVRGPIDETVSLLRRLHQKNTPLYGLTNWSMETFPLVYEQYDFFKLFTDIVISGKEGLIKPDPRIYELLLSRNQLVANECVFIDDNPHNVNAAEALNIKGIHFVSPQALEEELKQLGLQF